MRRPLLAILAAGSIHPFAPFYFAHALSSGSFAQRNRQRARPTAPGTITSNVIVTASPVQTQADTVALADLRYDEWIAKDDNGGDIAFGSDDPSSGPPLPSRYAFRMATAEIAAERTEGGAVAFLARLGMQPTANTSPEGKNGDDTAISTCVPVGAAELSPIEFDGAIIWQPPDGKDTFTAQQPTRLYVTDVVTSSKHRRMGIANTLMGALESFALEKFGTDTMLYLHVKEDNVAAQKFYQNPKRGYAAPTSEQLHNIDIRRLEDNAGTAGQILMCKSLLDCSLPVQLEKEKDDSNNIRGFGGTAAKGKTATQKNSKRKKR